MDDLVLTVFDTDDAHRAATLQALGQHLSEYHRWQTGGEWRELYVSLCDSEGQLCGSLLAYTHGLWLEVEFIWVAEPVRRRRHGSRLLQAAERAAQARGCQRAYLDTAASPAVDFFLQRGYQVCGELPDYRGGHSRYWLHKTLSM
jgi:ribosomal protein S18 acetylase RimI-like enzyme